MRTHRAADPTATHLNNQISQGTVDRNKRNQELRELATENQIDGTSSSSEGVSQESKEVGNEEQRSELGNQDSQLQLQVAPKAAQEPPPFDPTCVDCHFDPFGKEPFRLPF